MHNAGTRRRGLPSTRAKAVVPLAVVASVIALLSGCTSTPPKLTITCETLTVGDPGGLQNGDPTPVDAAKTYVSGSGVLGLPREGWHIIHQTQSTALLTADISFLYASTGADGTWFIGKAKVCRRQ